MATAQILIVEDDHIIVMELSDRLQSLGYAVCGTTAYGENAIEMAEEMQPDLVLMDIQLRGALDGVEAAAEIRARFDIPVVYLTAYADENTLQRAKITEPYGYIIKPLEEREVYTAVETALFKHQMERRLKESEKWLSATLKSIGDAVIAADEKGVISLMNPIAEALTDWEQSEAVGKDAAKVLEFRHEETRIAAESPIARALQQGLPVDLSRYILITKDGRETPIDGSTALIVDDKEEIVGVVLVFRDISQRKREDQQRERLQAQLYQAQRMEAIGVLAGGIAHEFNNLMTTVIGTSSLMLSGLDDKDPLRDGLERVRKASERAASLTQQILALSRKQTPQPKILDLNAVVIDMEEMLQRLVGADTDLVNALEPGFRYIRADPAQIEQIIMSLIVNAHEAMPEGGQVTVTTETVTLDEHQCQPLPEVQPGTYVRLSVADTGVGMDGETIQHIFEPFFSTKPKGSGLGLAIAHNVVRQNGGWIDVSSELGRGSTFQVYLPAFVTDLEYEPREIAPQTELQGAGERILLVEDDEGVCAAVSEMLRSGGYEVVAAGNAKMAADAFEEQGGAFHLVFCDVVLPDKDGLELVGELLSQKPGLPVLLTSGYTDERTQWLLIREHGFRFLQKPFGLSDLLPAIREAIHSSRGGSAP